MLVFEQERDGRVNAMVSIVWREAKTRASGSKDRVCKLAKRERSEDMLLEVG